MRGVALSGVRMARAASHSGSMQLVATSGRNEPVSSSHGTAKRRCVSHTVSQALADTRDPWCSPSVRCAAQDLYPAWHAVMLAGEMHMTVSFMLS